jgi:alpha-1,2-mannosyltransferase
MDGVKRLDRIGMIFWGFGLVLIAALLALDIANASGRPGYSINGQSLWGRDFVNLWSAGRLVIEGKTALIYDVEAYQAWQRAVLGPGIDNHNYSYPPVSLLYAPLFGALPYLAALALWLLLSATLFVVAARPWIERLGLPVWIALILPSTLLCLWAGHYGLIVGALWLFAWHWLDERPLRAGAAIGLMLVKPHLAILIPILLARRGAWRAFAAATATVAVLVTASALAFGPTLWRTYVESTSRLQLALVEEPHTLFGLMMPTPAPALYALGLPQPMVWTAQVLIVVAVVGLLLWRQPADRYRAGAAAAVATFLVLPYGFNYDLTVVGIAALMLLADASRSGRRPDAAVAGLALALPPAMMFLGVIDFRPAPFVLAALFWLLLRPQAPAESVASESR